MKHEPNCNITEKLSNVCSCGAHSAVITAWNRDEVAIILDALSAVDEKDLDYLASQLGDGGRDKFWKAVIASLRPVFNLEISVE